ncbi:MAG: hypothetical protein JSU72_04825 [Deltaproteobacteria bacterium]|nr:MAG: hypothetical protein JSU72_04825 [Deltaproteobacteria bacterium]
MAQRSSRSRDQENMTVGAANRFCAPLVGLVLILSLSAAVAIANPRSEHIVYFRNTPNELNIYRIQGHHPGPTLMLIGGIQGNEPGGFLSADLYADMALERGNLIVVPRANFNSILQFKRGVNGDMNRKFASERPADIEDQIVAVLKSLLSNSDCLLNLHEGSGFYSPRWESDMVNPMRYGQSLIADADRYYSERSQRWLELKAMAERVLYRVNQQIREPRHRFRFNNHRTADSDTSHAEQRKSATYYALTTLGIPAFGVETSKSLPSTEMKVRYHNLIINAFMKELGIVPETPPVNLAPPKLDYLVVAVNGALPVVVRHEQTLNLQHGDRVEIVHIEANYNRGLSADILGVGSLNDLRKSFLVKRGTDIVVRKDHLECGRVRLGFDSRGPGRKPVFRSPFNELGFIVKINGRLSFFNNEDRVQLVRGDRFEVVDVLLARKLNRKVKVNVKGFMSDPRNNTGEDRGYSIDTAKDMLPRHSVKKQGRHYMVLVQTNRVLGRLHLLLEPPHFRYLAVCIDGREKLWYLPGETIQLRRPQTLQVMDIRANLDPAEVLSVYCSQPAFHLGDNWREKVLHLAELLPAPSSVPSSFSWTIKRGDQTLGQIFVQVSP